LLQKDNRLSVTRKAASAAFSVAFAPITQEIKMNIATLLSKALVSVRLTPEERAQFRAEQINTVRIGKLPRVIRIFV
jgi:hypothetical protein